MARMADTTVSHRRPLAAWAWEGLRRNPAYRRTYFAHRFAKPRPVILPSGTRLLRPTRRFPDAEMWGLLTLADPDRATSDTDVFWHPDALAGAMRVHLSRASTTSETEDEDRIILSGLDSSRTVLETVARRRHIRLVGDDYWIQLYADTPLPIGDRTVVNLQFGRAARMRRRLDTARQLLALHRSEGQMLSLTGRRKNIRSIANALKAHDIAHGFERERGSLRDVARLIVGETRVAADWGHDRNLRDQARRAIARGERFVAGEYRRLLARKVL